MDSEVFNQYFESREWQENLEEIDKGGIDSDRESFIAANINLIKELSLEINSTLPVEYSPYFEKLDELSTKSYEENHKPLSVEEWTEFLKSAEGEELKYNLDNAMDYIINSISDISKKVKDHNFDSEEIVWIQQEIRREWLWIIRISHNLFTNDAKIEGNARNYVKKEILNTFDSIKSR